MCTPLPDPLPHRRAPRRHLRGRGYEHSTPPRGCLLLVAAAERLGDPMLLAARRGGPWQRVVGRRGRERRGERARHLHPEGRVPPSARAICRLLRRACGRSAARPRGSRRGPRHGSRRRSTRVAPRRVRHGTGRGHRLLVGGVGGAGPPARRCVRRGLLPVARRRADTGPRTSHRAAARGGTRRARRRPQLAGARNPRSGQSERARRTASGGGGVDRGVDPHRHGRRPPGRRGDARRAARDRCRPIRRRRRRVRRGHGGDADRRAPHRGADSTSDRRCGRRCRDPVRHRGAGRAARVGVRSAAAGRAGRRPPDAALRRGHRGRRPHTSSGGRRTASPRRLLRHDDGGGRGSRRPRLGRPGRPVGAGRPPHRGALRAAACAQHAQLARRPPGTSRVCCLAPRGDRGGRHAHWVTRAARVTRSRAGPSRRVARQRRSGANRSTAHDARRARARTGPRDRSRVRGASRPRARRRPVRRRAASGATSRRSRHRRAGHDRVAGRHRGRDPRRRRGARATGSRPVVATSVRGRHTLGSWPARARACARRERRRRRRTVPSRPRRAVTVHGRDRDGQDAAAVRRVAATRTTPQGSA